MDGRMAGYALIAVGVLFNNYVYLHDIIFGEGVTQLGPKSIPSIIITVIVIFIGLYLLTRPAEKGNGS